MIDNIKQHAPAAALTGVHIAAPLNPHGQCFGLIPAGGDWLDDLVDWSRRQFKRPEDAQRVAASWNLLAHVPLAELLDPVPQHPDDTAIDRFAASLKAAMATGRAQGKEGWHDKHYCSEMHLRTLMRVAISKGNPVHVGNYAMMLFNRGERTASQDAAALRAALEKSNLKGSMVPYWPSSIDQAVVLLTKAFDALEATADSDIDHFEDEADEAEGAPTQYAARKIAGALEHLYGFGTEPIASEGQAPARAAVERDEDDRSTWTFKEWYEHVGAWETPEGWLAFGSPMAVRAMLIQYGRTVSAAIQKQAREDAARLADSTGGAGKCAVPPIGWHCTRAAGHEGPCAAHPLKCDHDWPEGEGGTDLYGTCTKCGMGFQYMIHMEMP